MTKDNTKLPGTEKINDEQEEEEEKEIDLVALAQRIWAKRKFILKVTVVFLVIGLFDAIISPVEYTAQSVLVPQTSSSKNSNLSGLASMVGINLGSASQSETLSPSVYPNILNNVDFEKELISSKFKFDDVPDSISFYDYYFNPAYKKSSVLSYVMKYTFGLPGVIIKAVKGKKKEMNMAGTKSPLTFLTEKESQCMKMLQSKITMDINTKDGYITLTASMPTAVTAAQLVMYTQNLLQKYITEFKIDKAKQQLDYMEGRYQDAKKDYENKLAIYAHFQDANRGISTAVAQAQEQRMQDEYNLANTLYNQLAAQKIQAELQVKEDTPVLTVIEPVTVPNEKSKPKRGMIIGVFLFLGIIVGCGAVIVLDSMKNSFDTKLLRKWE